ncbi:MAG: biotin--[acetyl-CoA-carboxylase] ligase [Methanomicrobiaceae archaeon]|nr:biotin--[acetyl-CoA-carboxylase] ligase [Methanomicrobiaceae archaeon]
MNEAAFRVLALLDEADGPVSGASLSERLGMTRSAVWKHVRELREMGYEISASRTEGYALVSRSPRLLPYEIRRHLKTRVIGKDLKYFRSIPSTTGVAKELCASRENGCAHGAVIIAEEQTGGIGRLGRSWVSPEGGIWVTVILKPTIPMDHLFMITMAASIAVARAIRREFGIGALIKWPNDIYIGDRKVSGLLLELAAEADTVHYTLLGIGVDANLAPTDLPPNIRDITTTLRSELGHDVDRNVLLARILREFEQRYLLLENEEYDSILREWKSLSMTLNHRVHIKTVRKSFDGEAIDIDRHGALIVRKDSGKIERVFAGDCFFV